MPIYMTSLISSEKNIFTIEYEDIMFTPKKHTFGTPHIGSRIYKSNNIFLSSFFFLFSNIFLKGNAITYTKI